MRPLAHPLLRAILGLLGFVLLSGNAGTDERLDRFDVHEIIRSGKDVLPRLEKIADRDHLKGDALHYALSEIARIHFEEGRHNKCIEICLRFLTEFPPDSYNRTLEKYVLIGDCHKKLGNDATARSAYLRVFYHFNNSDYAYSGIREKLAKRISLKIRPVKWDGKKYDIPVFPTAEEQIAFASQGELILGAEKDARSTSRTKAEGTDQGFPEARAYNIGVQVAAYRAVMSLFPKDEAMVAKARKGFQKSAKRQRALVAALDATIQDPKAQRSARYSSVQWLGKIGGEMVVPSLRRAQPLQFKFADHDVVDNVMRRLGIQK